MFALLQAAHLLEERLEATLGEAGLSTPKFRVLTQLVESGRPLTLGELATGQSCVRSNITQLVDRLESDGFVRRVDDPSDRRSIRAELTPLGVERQAEGDRRAKELQESFASSLSHGDRAALERVLESIK